MGTWAGWSCVRASAARLFICELTSKAGRPSLRAHYTRAPMSKAPLPNPSRGRRATHGASRTHACPSPPTSPCTLNPVPQTKIHHPPAANTANRHTSNSFSKTSRACSRTDCMCSHMQTLACAHMHAHMHSCMHAHMHACKHVLMHACTHVHHHAPTFSSSRCCRSSTMVCSDWVAAVGPAKNVASP